LFQARRFGLELPVQVCQSGFEHLAMSWIRRRFELLEDMTPGEFQPAEAICFLDLRGTQLREEGFLGCSFFLLLLDGFAFPSTGHG
jgi:hypothetical protein